MARQIQVAPSTYREWEYGRAIKGEPYAKLAQVFQTTLSELLLGEEARSSTIRKDLQEVEEILQRIKSRI